MEDCTSLSTSNMNMELDTQYSMTRGGSNIPRTYLCPVQGQGLKAAGSFYDRLFSYIKVSLKGCDDSVVDECYDDETVSQK